MPSYVGSHAVKSWACDFSVVGWIVPTAGPDSERDSVQGVDGGQEGEEGTAYIIHPSHPYYHALSAQVHENSL